VSVHFFHGDKGGVGKSFVAQSFVDWLVTRDIAPLVIDSDMRNPDVARMFPDVAVTVDLRKHEGWLELLSLLHESDREQVVVSLPAGIGAEMTAELPAFFDGLRELGRDATLLWVLARTADSINLLRSATAAFDGQARAMIALKNLFFGDPAKFGRWNESRTRTAFEDAGGVVVDSPSCSIGSSIRPRRPTRRWRSRRSSTVCVSATAPSCDAGSRKSTRSGTASPRSSASP